MAASLTAIGCKPLPSSFHGSWATSFLAGEEPALLSRTPVPTSVRVARPRRPSPRMGNVNEGKGLFAPAVVFVRNIVGRKRFNQLRGKAIALHSQVITEFCKTIGADGKQRQGLIRLAKKNGEKLGFLA
ncbi:protein PROTON GRADIENT REGULATION 5, chloroplastic-like [Canna indica]|uniref:Protein PROTON GRADIENT REGULATION 5, chloroplastic-like n=1 Tax=Canna indica TaxID=4628 RepID=A0AAQ3Q1Y3_9LILI|nr:protein PROTON GRADIENT REGULATION 5, chloroplastic-like [Canna indica]